MNRDSRQAQTLLRVFEALGVPLIGAVDELMAWQHGGPNAGTIAPEDAAKRFAALLAAAIGTGSQLAGRFAPKPRKKPKMRASAPRPLPARSSRSITCSRARCPMMPLTAAFPPLLMGF